MCTNFLYALKRARLAQQLMVNRQLHLTTDQGSGFHKCIQRSCNRAFSRILHGHNCKINLVGLQLAKGLFNGFNRFGLYAMTKK